MQTRVQSFSTSIFEHPDSQDFYYLVFLQLMIQIFHYTRWITSKRVTRWRGPFPRHYARTTQLFSKKCRSGYNRWQHCVRFDRPEI